MIKSLMMPVILAIVTSLAGSAGYSIVKARATHAAWQIAQDSIAAVHADSAAHDSASVAGDDAHDPDGSDHSTMDTDVPSLEYALTPADSIRALIAEPQLRDDASAGDDHASAAPESSTPSKSSSTPAATPPPKAPVSESHAEPQAEASTKPEPPTVVAPPKAAKVVAEVLPERRLAKIFSAMSARDAAKVLEQMSDSDIRTIVSMMGDRQAAAVLTALPAARAATISRGGARAPEGITP